MQCAVVIFCSNFADPQFLCQCINISMYVLYSRIFCWEKISPLLPPALMSKFLSHKLFVLC